MNNELKLIKSNDLSAVETVLIENIYLILNKRDRLIKEIVEHVDDYKKVIEAAQELKFIDGYKGTIHELKEQFFEHASVQTLTKIVNEEKFNPSFTYQEAFLISKAVVKEFRYGAEVRSDNPKAAIAKKLGAKLIA